MYVLDSNIIIDALGGDQKLAERLSKLTGRPKTTVINYAECLMGVDNDEYDSLRHHLTSQYEILEMTIDTAEIFVSLKKDQKRSGRPVPDIDLYIASIAIANNMTLVTRDRHFSLIPGLSPLVI